MTRTSRRSERGSATIEMVIIAPAFVLTIMLLVMGGRYVLAKQSVDAAASEAARTATLTRGEGDAIDRGRQAALTYLDEQDLSCTGEPTVEIDPQAFQSAPGTEGMIEATVQCRVNLAGLELPLVGNMDVTGRASSPLDTYRER